MADSLDSNIVENITEKSVEEKNAEMSVGTTDSKDTQITGEQDENKVVEASRCQESIEVSSSTLAVECTEDNNKILEKNNSTTLQEKAETITSHPDKATEEIVTDKKLQKCAQKDVEADNDSGTIQKVHEINDSVEKLNSNPSLSERNEDLVESTESNIVDEIISMKLADGKTIEDANVKHIEEESKTTKNFVRSVENIAEPDDTKKSNTQQSLEDVKEKEVVVEDSVESNISKENIEERTKERTGVVNKIETKEKISTEGDKLVKNLEKSVDSVVAALGVVQQTGENTVQQPVETEIDKAGLEQKTEVSKETGNSNERTIEDSNSIADKMNKPLEETEENNSNINSLETTCQTVDEENNDEEPIKAIDNVENIDTGRNSATLSDDATESQDSEQLVIDENIATIKNVDEISTTIEIDDDEENNIESKSKKTDQEIKTSFAEPCFEVIEIDDDEEEIGGKKLQEIVAEEPNVASSESAAEPTKEGVVKIEEETSIVSSTSGAPFLFYNKECINFECAMNKKEFHRAPQFALNYFKVVKKKMKVQYICSECYDMALSFYQDLSGLLDAKQPILLKDIANKKQEFVEILDSSDEEEDASNDAESKVKDNQFFSKTDLNLIENELENSIRSVFDRVEIQNQLTWTKSIFIERMKRLQNELENIDNEICEQQKLADKMYLTLYDAGKNTLKSLKPIDLDTEIDSIPPIGEVERLPIKVNETYYAAKAKAIGSWLPCRVIEQTENVQMGPLKSTPCYRVKFLSGQYPTFKNLSAKLIAYYDPPSVRLLVGQRVIAYFDGTTLLPRDKDKCVMPSAFYPGIIAEEMKPNNYFRYLIFYDDGYTQYVSHKDVRLVCNVSRNVWEDVDPASREFVQKYLLEYRVNRPMVQAHKGQKMLTESNNRWFQARVIDIDCSLVCMHFEGSNNNRTEWIYRGSLRLNPVYMEYQKTKTTQANRMMVSRLPRRTEPFIRYTEDEESIRGTLGTQSRSTSNRQDTSTNEAPKVRHLNANTIYLEDENKTKGKVIHYTAKRQFPQKLYRRHTCGPQCLFNVPHNLNGYSPLAKPLLSGWERIFSRQKLKKFVSYRAPCGKMFRSMTEVHKYLRVTKNPLNVDNFDFYPETSCLAEFEAENVLLKKRDISNGQEKMPIPLVNYYDDSLPECTYSSRVIPTEGVNINTDPNFLICCDCEDDCVDKENCACWQLTIDGVRNTNPDAQINDIGYQYKRLYEHLTTGIYECNSRCKCKSYCINRVVQHSLEMKLQVFKTTNRGWGLRCLNDVPRGAFVCIYAGNLLTEAKANEGGLDAGDEYFAELDYIETVEQLKEGYESDVDNQYDEEDEDPYVPEDNDDDDFTPSKSFVNRSKRSPRQNSGEGERQAIHFNPNTIIDEDTKKKRLSVRQLFGRDEAVYVMDAKVTGNLGRYFNHSCSPNLFVQNVFVDTHDVRFPWVAFFALTHIRAGTELTWNYNYEVGVVPGKVLYCQCGAPNCRQRLL